jgi:hypothetical protein
MNRKSRFACLALLAGLAPVAWGQTLYGSHDECTESSTESVNLPVTVPYRMTLQPCPTCQALEMQVDASTKFYVGNDQVDLQTLRSYASRRVQQLNVCRAAGTQRLTRIVLVAQLDTAGLPQPSDSTR